jgi:hypothetical protein
VPFDYVADHDKRRLTIIWHPPVGPEDVQAIVERQASEGAWSYGVLHDTRSISDTGAGNTSPVLETVARLSKTHGSRGPVALVAAPQTVGIAQAYAIRGTKATAGAIQVFWDKQEAEEWLDSQS